MDNPEQKKTFGLSLFGIFLILLGIVLILSKLEFLHYGWKTMLWICLGIFGLAVAIHAFAARRRSSVFWGSLLFFISIAVLVRRLLIIDAAALDLISTISLALGLSFFILFLYDPGRFGVLIPALFFCAYGALYYLWWWDVLDWYEIRRYFAAYWPVLVIIWGLSLVLQRRK